MMLSAKQVETASPKTKPYRLFDGHGLYLEVVPTGGKYWRFKCEFQAKERRLAFGKYPDISLANARLKRDEARQQLANGVDPWSSRQDKKRQAKIKSDTTFELVTREWHELSNTENFSGPKWS